MALAAFGIFIPNGRFAWETEDQNVVPTVLVEIVSESEKVVRIRVVDAQRAFEAFDGLLFAFGRFFVERLRRGIIFVALLEIRSLIPIRAGDDVRFAVVIEVAEVCPFRPVLVAESGLLEGVKQIIISGAGDTAGEERRKDEREFVHAQSLSATGRTVKPD